MLPVLVVIGCVIAVVITFLFRYTGTPVPAGSPAGTVGTPSSEWLRLTIVFVAVLIGSIVAQQSDWTANWKNVTKEISAITPDMKIVTKDNILPNGPDAVIDDGKITILGDPPAGMDYVNVIPITAAGQGTPQVMSGREFKVPTGAIKVQLQWQAFHGEKNHSLRTEYDVP